MAKQPARLEDIRTIADAIEALCARPDVLFCVKAIRRLARSMGCEPKRIRDLLRSAAMTNPAFSPAVGVLSEITVEMLKRLH